MSSTMALWDMVPTMDLSDYLPPLPTREPGTCERCGRPVGPATSRNHLPNRFCCELCRKRAERARWKAKWKKRGVNKYIGGKMNQNDSLIFYTPDEALKVAIASDFVATNPPMQESARAAQA